MCGIAGIVDFNRLDDAERRVRSALSRLARRGPDGEGYWSDDMAALGHRRLSIIDLSAAADQPMHSADDSTVIVFNGEIYNYREVAAQLPGGQPLRTSSDTEVLLAAYAAWGADCLQRLHGMFSFVIWNKRTRTLFGARDRLGVKPFYYSYRDGRFCFASRPRAVQELMRNGGGKMSSAALRLYLEAGYVPAPLSFFDGIEQLEPGHFVEVGADGLRTRRYWDFAAIEPEASWVRRSEDDLLDELDEIVTASVRMRLVSDVPLGAFLSGGIDSSLVVGIMAKLSSDPVRTCSIGFSESLYDESGYAGAVAKHLGTRHVMEKVSADDLLALLPRFLDEFDEPFFDSSAFPTLAVARLARREVTVALSGDGGDELFGGYHYYSIMQRLGPLFRMPAALRSAAAMALAGVPSHRAKLLAAVLGEADETAAFAKMRSVSKDFPIPMLESARQGTTLRDLYAAAAKRESRSLNPVDLAMRLDMRFTLPGDYLQKVDLATMAFSLESREPLLDHKLVEWAMRLPLEWKLRGDSKYLLRRLAYRYVPRELLERPKMGFRVPIDKWLRGQLRNWAAERIHSAELYEDLPLDRAAVSRLFDLHLSERRNVHPLLWAVLMLLEFVSRSRAPLRSAA
jgi:asparagine synthase (glutamine-hydrolysing)